jgi:dolichyl-phosphate-mannose-protein mannosyltransferase
MTGPGHAEPGAAVPPARHSTGQGSRTGPGRGAGQAGHTAQGSGAGQRSRTGHHAGAGLARHATGLARRGGVLAREHWLFTAALAAGLVLRVLTQIAYRPALLYIDSLKYLYHSGGADPVGYRVLLWPVLAVGNLDAVAVVQHLLGLAMAITLYLLLQRRAAPRWLAALATLPLLLDGYQLQIEQTIMPDVMFETLLVAGLAALLWHPRPKTWMVITAGLALGASATARQVGEIFLLPALAYLLAATTGGWRRLLRDTALLTAAFALPILGYCSAALAATGHFRLSYTGTNEFYGRLVLAGDCGQLTLPRYERPLCPGHRQAVSLGIDGLEHNPSSPLRTYTPPAGMTWAQVVSDFNHRLAWHDPAAVAAAIGRSALTLFALDRGAHPGDTPISRWQFQRGYPFYPTSLYSSTITPAVVGSAGDRFGGGGPVAVRPLAAFLRGYQLGGGYTPGPLLAFAALAGLMGSLAAAGRRTSPARRGAATGCLLFFASAVAVLLASDAFEFSWRYQLPALVTLPPAGALAIAVLLGRPARSPAAATGEVVPDPLEPRHRHDDHGGQRDQDGHRQPAGSAADQDGPGERADDDGGQHADAAVEPVGPGPGDQAGQDAREGARQIGA